MPFCRGGKRAPDSSALSLASAASGSEIALVSSRAAIRDPHGSIVVLSERPVNRLCCDLPSGRWPGLKDMNPTPAHLLVIDDIEANRDLLARRLRRAGYRVTATADGAHGLALLEAAAQPVAERFDVLLLDVMMPGISGLDVLRCVRKTQSLATLPVIMATARDASAQVVEALALGANDYVTKPFDFQVVLARVQTQVTLKRSVDRIVELEQSLERRADELAAANTQLELTNGRMKADLKAAALVQRALLPVALPTAQGTKFAYLFEPSAELSGDILNVVRLDERRLGMYVLDVSGHGVAAALLSFTLSKFLSPAPDPSSVLWHWRPLALEHMLGRDNTAASYSLSSPSEVVTRLNVRFPFDVKVRQYFTMLYGILDVTTNEFSYTSAGHPGFIHLRAGAKPCLIETPGLPVGVGNESYEEHTLKLASGDRLFFYSDGVTEAMAPDRELFELPRLIDLLAETRAASLGDSLRTVRDGLRRWVAREWFDDDVSILALEVGLANP